METSKGLFCLLLHYIFIKVLCDEQETFTYCHFEPIMMQRCAVYTLALHYAALVTFSVFSFKVSFRQLYKTQMNAARNQ